MIVLMPMSIDPQLGDDEIECANCGARIYYELTRCPNCGVSLYEPEEDFSQKSFVGKPGKKGLWERLDEFVHRLTKRPYAVDELFGTAINQAELFDSLLLRVGGDRPTVERLIEYERRKLPRANRLVWIQNAIQHWEQDNKVSGGKA